MKEKTKEKKLNQPNKLSGYNDKKSMFRIFYHRIFILTCTV